MFNTMQNCKGKQKKKVTKRKSKILNQETKLFKEIQMEKFDIRMITTISQYLHGQTNL